jgi:hypothetical protein
VESPTCVPTKCVGPFYFRTAARITTQVRVMVPRALAARKPRVDVVAAMDDHPCNRAVSLKW